jgi:hypothetical protein
MTKCLRKEDGYGMAMKYKIDKPLNVYWKCESELHKPMDDQLSCKLFNRVYKNIHAPLWNMLYWDLSRSIAYHEV